MENIRKYSDEHMTRLLYQEIIEAYKKTGSINKTVELINRQEKRASKIKIQKVLITEGLWSSRSSRQIGELLKQGKTTEEIAEALHMSMKNVQSYLPYTRGEYGDGPVTQSAEISKTYRERQKAASRSLVRQKTNYKYDPLETMERALEKERKENENAVLDGKAAFDAEMCLEEGNTVIFDPFEMYESELKMETENGEIGPVDLWEAKREAMRQEADEILSEDIEVSDDVSSFLNEFLNQESAGIDQTYEDIHDKRIDAAGEAAGEERSDVTGEAATEERCDAAGEAATEERSDAAGEAATEDSKKLNRIDREITVERDPLILGTLFYKLHLELLGDLTEEQKETLKKYGKTEGKICRDVVVPAEMNLHSVHYMIQCLFGFGNRYHHEFNLPDDVYKDLFGSAYDAWSPYCGVYFANPLVYDQDAFWDDDYQPGLSLKTWYKTKYSAPYVYGGLEEHFLLAQEAVRKTVNLGQSVQEKNQLLERLTLHELLLKGKNESTEKNQGISEQDAVFFENHAGADPTFYEQLKEKVEALGNRCHGIFFDRIVTMDQLREIMNFDLLLEENEARKQKEMGTYKEPDPGEWTPAREASYMYYRYLYESDPAVVPVTDTIYYQYDPTDEWKVKISLSDVFSAEDIQHDEVSDREAELLLGGQPVCTAAEGLPVFDDIGGLSGFCDFLKLREEGTKEEKETQHILSKDSGWSNRLNRPENIL